MKKRPTRRSEAKYPALDPNLNLKTRIDLLDFDYIDSLPEEWIDPKTGKKYNPKQFLNDYANEAIHADFKTNEEEGRKRIHKKKRVPSPKNLELKKVLAEITATISGLVALINGSRIKSTSKINIKRIINKMKKQIRTQVGKEMKFIEDFYKKDAEDKNNARNSCILTTSKAQGKVKGLMDVNENYSRVMNEEDKMIELLDAKREED